MLRIDIARQFDGFHHGCFYYGRPRAPQHHEVRRVLNRFGETAPRGSGRDTSRLQLVRLENAHGLTLLDNDILHRRRDMLWLPQPSCASMACPSLSVRRIQVHPVQTATGVSFEVAHNSLRRNTSASTTVCT
jgi:hypothetical protein